MLVDLSHVSDDTAAQALQLSHAPVIWSHSSARAVHNVARNVPDYILEMIGIGKGKKDGVVMVGTACSTREDPEINQSTYFRLTFRRVLLRVLRMRLLRQLRTMLTILGVLQDGHSAYTVYSNQ